MTPDSLQRLNDLRQRIVLADEAARAGSIDQSRALMPSDDEIVEALRLARADRSQATSTRAAKAEAKASSNKFQTLSLDDIFS